MKIDSSGPTDWRKLREFSAVDLDRSFVLSWHVESENLLIDVDLYLAPEHPFYEKPRPAEKACIRPAIIEFGYCESLATANGSLESIAETVESLGHGAISGLQRHEDGRYEIIGEFGNVFVVAERPLLRLKGP